jgi:AcrR family transcriptional regulator
MSDVLLNGLAAREVNVDLPSKPMPTPFEEGDRLSRESFLRAATHLINEQGYRGASVERISSYLKVTKGAFYHHNETRDGLVVACFERTFDIIREAQDLAYLDEADGVSHVLGATIPLVTRQLLPEGALLRTSALTAINLALRKGMQLRLSILTGRFADMLNDGLIDGSIRPCDFRIAAEMITAMINAAQELPGWVRGVDMANAAGLYVRPLFSGLIPASRGRRRRS